MRRWVCIVALLLGFSAEDYTRSIRTRTIIPVERLLDPDRHDPDLPEAAWWRTT